MKAEIQRLKKEVQELGTYHYHPNISFGFTAIMSMIDGKVVNVWHENDCTTSCPFCLVNQRSKDYKKKYKGMEIKDVFKAEPDLLSHLCLSTLHFGPRSMEHLFKIGFYQPFKLNQCRGKENKKIMKKRKDDIKAVFKAEGLPIFEPRANGAGNSNDGNMARR